MDGQNAAMLAAAECGDDLVMRVVGLDLRTSFSVVSFRFRVVSLHQNQHQHPKDTQIVEWK